MASWVKDPALPQLRLGFNPRPRKLPYTTGCSQKKKKKKIPTEFWSSSLLGWPIYTSVSPAHGLIPGYTAHSLLNEASHMGGFRRSQPWGSSTQLPTWSPFPAPSFPSRMKRFSVSSPHWAKYSGVKKAALRDHTASPKLNSRTGAGGQWLLLSIFKGET